MKAKLIEILRPTLPVVFLAAVLFLLSLIIFVTNEGTSKVSWDQYREAPLIALKTLKYTGPCVDGAPCTRVAIGEIFPITLLTDLMFWYVLSAVGVWGFKTIRK